MLRQQQGMQELPQLLVKQARWMPQPQAAIYDIFIYYWKANLPARPPLHFENVAAGRHISTDFVGSGDSPNKDFFSPTFPLLCGFGVKRRRGDGIDGRGVVL